MSSLFPLPSFPLEYRANNEYILTQHGHRWRPKTKTKKMQHAALMVEMEDSFAGTNAKPNASPNASANASANANGGNSPELPPWREVDLGGIGTAARPIVVDDDGDDDHFDASTMDGDDASRGDGASRAPDGLKGHAVHAWELSPGDQVPWP